LPLQSGCGGCSLGPAGHTFHCDADVTWLTSTFSITSAGLVNAVCGGIASVKRLQPIEQMSFRAGRKNREGRRTTMKRWCWSCRTFELEAVMALGSKSFRGGEQEPNRVRLADQRECAMKCSALRRSLPWCGLSQAEGIGASSGYCNSSSTCLHLDHVGRSMTGGSLASPKAESRPTGFASHP